MPEYYSNKEILNAAAAIFNIEGQHPREQRKKLHREHASHGGNLLDPVYVRRQHAKGPFLEMHPSTDHKTVEFILHIPGTNRRHFALSKDSLDSYTDTQREQIMDTLALLQRDLNELEAARIVPSSTAVLV